MDNYEDDELLDGLHTLTTTLSEKLKKLYPNYLGSIHISLFEQNDDTNVAVVTSDVNGKLMIDHLRQIQEQIEKEIDENETRH